MIPGVVSCVMVLLGDVGGGDGYYLIFDDFVGEEDTLLDGRTPPVSLMGSWNIDDDYGLSGKLDGEGYAVADDQPIVGGYFYNSNRGEVPYGFETAITFRMPTSTIDATTVDWQTIVLVWITSYDGAYSFLEVNLRYINPSYESEEPYTGFVLHIGSRYNNSINLRDGSDEEGYFTIPLPDLVLTASSTHMLFVSVEKSGLVQVWIDDIAYLNEVCNTTVTEALSTAIEEIYFEAHPGDPVPDTDPSRAPADLDKVSLSALASPGNGDVIYLLDEFDGAADAPIAGRTPTITIPQFGNWSTEEFTSTGKLDGSGFAVQSVPGDPDDGVSAYAKVASWEGPWPGPGTGAVVSNGFRLSCTFRTPAAALNTFDYVTLAALSVFTKPDNENNSDLSVGLAYSDATGFRLDVFSSLNYGDVPLYEDNEIFTVEPPLTFVDLEPLTLHTLTVTVWPADEFSTHWVQFELDNETWFGAECNTQVVNGLLTDITEVAAQTFPGVMIGEDPAVSCDLSRASLVAFDAQSPS